MSIDSFQGFGPEVASAKWGTILAVAVAQKQRTPIGFRV